MTMRRSYKLTTAAASRLDSCSGTGEAGYPGRQWCLLDRRPVVPRMGHSPRVWDVVTFERCSSAGEPNKRVSKDAAAAYRGRVLEQEAKRMKRDLRVLAAAGSLSLVLAITDAAFAQKSGGILKISHF